MRRPIFVHITKTGGTSIAKALDLPKVADHRYATEIKACVNSNEWWMYFKFAFVRNPWDKVVSQYHYNHHKWVKKGTPFEEYVRLFYHGVQLTTHSPFHFPYIMDENDEIMVDYIGRFENLQGDFNIICNKLGRPLQTLPKENASDRRDRRGYRAYYSVSTANMVEEIYEKEISFFNYSF